MSTTLIGGSYLTRTLKLSFHPTHVFLYYYVLEISIITGYCIVTVLYFEFSKIQKYSTWVEMTWSKTPTNKNEMFTSLIGANRLTLNCKWFVHSTHVFLYMRMLEMTIVMQYLEIVVLRIELNIMSTKVTKIWFLTLATKVLQKICTFTFELNFNKE